MNLPNEFKVMRVRECLPEPAMIDTPARAVEYPMEISGERSGAQRTDPINQIEPNMSVRVLKIEADGDEWKGIIKPKIRLMGRWLERAGFKAGSHVQVTCLAPGLIELCSADALIVNEKKQTSAAQLPA